MGNFIMPEEATTRPHVHTLRAREAQEAVEALVSDLELIHHVYQVPNLTEETLRDLPVDLFTFLADTIVARIFYAFFSPSPSEQYCGHLVPAIWEYRIAYQDTAVKEDRPPQPLGPPTWSGALFDVFLEYTPQFKQKPREEQMRRLSSFLLPWQPNTRTLVLVRQRHVDRVIKTSGELAIVRSHYDVSHD